MITKTYLSLFIVLSFLTVVPGCRKSEKDITRKESTNMVRLD